MNEDSYIKKCQLLKADDSSGRVEIQEMWNEVVNTDLRKLGLREEMTID